MSTIGSTASSAAATSSSSQRVGLFGFGAKKLGIIASIALLLNNIAGIEVLRSGIVVEASGWFLALITLLCVATVALFATLFLAKAIATLPDNITYKYRIEFARLAQRLFPQWLYLLVLLLVVGDLLLCNLDSISVSAEIMDNTFLKLFGKTCAWVLSGSTTVECVEESVVDKGFNTSPWGSKYIVSLGWLVVVAVCLPISSLSLASTWMFQLIAFSLRLFCQLIWIFQLFALGESGESLPAVGSATNMKYTNYAQAMIFMFSCVITVPSWLNEKKTTVPVVLSTSMAIAIAFVLYYLLGVLSAVALVFPPGSDLASVLVDTPNVWGITKFAVYAFPLSDLFARIPVFSIVARYNLINTHFASPHVARFITIVMPAVLAILDYNGNTGHTVIIWIATVGLPIINFMMPVSTYISLRHNGADKYTLPIEMSTEALTEQPLHPEAEGLTEVVDQTEELPGLTVQRNRSSAMSFLLPSWARPLVPSAITARTQRRVIKAQQHHKRIGLPKEQSERRLDTSTSMMSFEIETIPSNYALSSDATRSSRFGSDPSSSGSNSRVFDTSLLNMFSAGGRSKTRGALQTLRETDDEESTDMTATLLSSEEMKADAPVQSWPVEGGVDASLLVQNMKLNVDKVIPIVPPSIRHRIREQHVAFATLVLGGIITVVCTALQIVNTTEIESNPEP